MTAQATMIGFTWRSLLRLAAVVDLVLLVATTILLTDLLALVLAAISVAGLVLLRFSGGLLGVLALLGLFADLTLYTLSGAVTNLANGEPLPVVALPAALAVTSVAGLIAALVTLLRWRAPQTGDSAARAIGLSAIALFALMLAAGLVLGSRQKPVPKATDILLVSENIQYSQRELSAPAGEITVVLDNRDLFWHTFSIDPLKVDLKVPMSGRQQVTFTAAPGTYRFYCSIPAHEPLGMWGTLTVR